MTPPDQHHLWPQVPLGELAVLKTGPFGSALHKSDYVVGGTPIVNPMHIVNGRIVPSDGARVGPTVVERLAEFKLIAGDVVLGRRGEMGRCAVVESFEEGWLCGTGSLIVRSLGAVRARYLQRYLSSPSVVRRLEEESVGSTMVNLNQSILRNLNVPVPPLSEQKRIADKLDALLARVDGCRERIGRIPVVLKRFRQAVLAAATSGELTREWREERGDDGEWPVEELQNVCESIADGDHQAPPKAETGIPFITISAMNTGTLRLEEATRFVPREYFDSLKPERRPEQGDVLLSVTGSIGIAAIVDTDTPFVFQRHIATLRPKRAKVSGKFLHYRLSADDMKRQGAAVATGTAQLTIPIGALRAFTLAVPGPDEQDEIVRRIDVLFGLADALEARWRMAEAQAALLTPSLLAKAFRGELVPQDPNDEPASDLLGRIRSRGEVTGKAKEPKPGGTRSPRTKAKIETDMLTRKDVTPTHLTTILKERGALSAEALWTASQLEIDDFYDQLKDEEARGLLRENRGDRASASRLLEPAA